MRSVVNLEFRDYNDFVKKHGLPFSGKPICIAMGMVGNLFEGAGFLLQKQLLDCDLLDLPVEMIWEKIEPIVEGAEKDTIFHDSMTILNIYTMKCRKKNKDSTNIT